MDYLSLKAAVAEAQKRLSGRKVIDAWQTSPREVVLKFHSRPGMVLSIDPVHPGLFLYEPETLPGKWPSPFSDLMRARIKGTTVASLRLPDAGERTVFITFTTSWPARESIPLTMVVEVMGRRSNLMLLEEGRILQPLRTVSKDKSPVRPVVAGQTYVTPPPQKGLPLEEVPLESLSLVDSKTDTGELMQVIRGLSPYTAGQAVRMSAPAGHETRIKGGLSGAIQEMLASCTGEIGFLHQSGGKAYLAPFKPVTLEISDTVDQYKPFSAAAKVWRASDGSKREESRSEIAILNDELLIRAARIESSLRHLDAEEERCRNHNEIRIMAETLLIHLPELEPGTNSVTLPDPYNPGLSLMIPIDPNKSTQENANELFNRARRLKRGLEEVSARRKSIASEMKALRSAQEALNLRNDPEPARKLLDVRPSGALKKGNHLQSAYSGPGRRYKVDGFTILVGKSSIDNEKVTFKAAGPGDIWLHARDYPGSHVVILTGKKQVPDKVLYAAAHLAAKRSGAANETAPEIMVTERKWVHKLKGGKPGQVTVEKFKTIRPRKK